MTASIDDLIAAHVAARGIHPCPEATDLVSIGEDMLGRERFLTPAAAAGWAAMRRAADGDGVQLLLVSAFRSVSYQWAIFAKKLAAGATLDEILQVNMPPGYSEHHSGRAIDLATPGAAPLSEEFETTPAFAWLMENASRWNFSMTYPRGNAEGLIYEPWHWAYLIG
jgi:D-alanyl-D-alanine carboxypeptidase